jgi:hypothetical protein
MLSDIITVTGAFLFPSNTERILYIEACRIYLNQRGNDLNNPRKNLKVKPTIQVPLIVKHPAA